MNIYNIPINNKVTPIKFRSNLADSDTKYKASNFRMKQREEVTKFRNLRDIESPYNSAHANIPQSITKFRNLADIHNINSISKPSHVHESPTKFRENLLEISSEIENHRSSGTNIDIRENTSAITCQPKMSHHNQSVHFNTDCSNVWEDTVTNTIILGSNCYTFDTLSDEFIKCINKTLLSYTPSYLNSNVLPRINIKLIYKRLYFNKFKVLHNTLQNIKLLYKDATGNKQFIDLINLMIVKNETKYEFLEKINISTENIIKESRNINKKIKQIEALKSKSELNTEQLDKIESLNYLIIKRYKLEKLLK